MRSIALTQTQKKRVTTALLVVAGLLAADCAYQLAMHVKWNRWITAVAKAQSPTTQPASTQPASASQPTTTQAASAPAATPPGPTAKAAGPGSDELPRGLRRRNPFTEPPQKGHGMRLTGVLGKTVLFEGRSGAVAIEEGKSAQGVKVTAIDGYKVTIEYENKPETMNLFP